MRTINDNQYLDWRRLSLWVRRLWWTRGKREEDVIFGVIIVVIFGVIIGFGVIPGVIIGVGVSVLLAGEEHSSVSIINRDIVTPERRKISTQSEFSHLCLPSLLHRGGLGAAVGAAGRSLMSDF